MSLLLLKGRKAPSSVKSTYVSRDYAIWDQPDEDMDEGPQQQKTVDATTNNQLGFLMRKTWRTPIPVGTIVQYAGSNAPIGWLFCDGSSYVRDEYSDLWAIIQDTYGSTSGTTFKVPDFRQRIPMGFDATYNNDMTRMDLNLNILGATGGELEHTLDRAEMPTHRHGPTDVDGSNNGTGFTSIDGSHNHIATDSGHVHVIETDDGGSGGGTGQNTGSDTLNTSDGVTNTGYANITVNYNGDHSHTIGNTGGNLPHNIVQKYVVVNYIIKW
jgi:microcystin-dependent protein